MASSARWRVAVLGQKDALARALCDLAQLRRGRRLEVLVIVPKPPARGLQGVDVYGLCTSLSFAHVRGETDEIVHEELRRFEPDLIVSILWPRRIQEETLALCRDCINFHPSLLPRHRGSLTQFWAVFDGDAEAGATCHRMVREFDAGLILHQVAFPVTAEDTALSLAMKMATAIEQCFQHVIRLFFGPDGLPEGSQWDTQAFPYHFRRLPRDGVVDPAWPEEKVERFIRAMYFPPHPPALAAGPTGELHFVTTLEEYRAVSAGAPVEPPPGGSSPSAAQRPAVAPQETESCPGAGARARVTPLDTPARGGRGAFVATQATTRPLAATQRP